MCYEVAVANTTSVTVKMIEVSADSKDHGSATATQPDDNPDRQCPLHNKPHSLRKCHGFSNRTQDKRKAYLKDKHICFRCILYPCDKLGSVEVTNTSQCCIQNQQARVDHSGEQQQELEPSVNPKCTKVCGSVSTSKSCSILCLVLV